MKLMNKGSNKNSNLEVSYLVDVKGPPTSHKIKTFIKDLNTSEWYP